MRRAVFLSTVFVSAVAAAPVLAQDREISFALRGGLAVAPSYPGADDYEVGPDLGFAFGGLSWGRVNIGRGIGAAPQDGLSFRGAFKVIGDREADDNSELLGLDDVSTAVELGIGATYRQANWLAFGEVRKGVTGHSGWTGTLGADAIFKPDDRWTITAGPRVSFGDSDFADTYFGITDDEATASSFGAFDADGGALGAGFEVQASYLLSEQWSVEGALGYERLLGDAADSPITELGSDDQWRLRIGLSRKFSLNF
ncbi:MipA/OmpV family protein [Sulfitobacter sp. S190]|uniref:MipA/OmpV family protein n=1 Tax=Sulfitobacter sp. S190 TaxID=2867022 RepID=UPI0021A30DED|nr:MipA/OmpV family protein [Sulfitobacter sp. S190]UWR24298.1 MipA/OmpV family protein [Sulfitobacter sp. S190]